MDANDAHRQSRFQISVDNLASCQRHSLQRGVVGQGQGRAGQRLSRAQTATDENPQLMTVYKCLARQPGSKDINQLELNQPPHGHGGREDSVMTGCELREG